jgi:tellurite resistance-related uncharacterized protein
VTVSDPSPLARDALASAASEPTPNLRSCLPAGLEIYACTPDFTHHTLPADLSEDHALAEGVWGVLRVLEGTLTYIAANHPWPTTVAAGNIVIIEPQLVHRLQLAGPTRFFIELHRSKDPVRADTPSDSR